MRLFSLSVTVTVLTVVAAIQRAEASNYTCYYETSGALTCCIINDSGFYFCSTESSPPGSDPSDAPEVIVLDAGILPMGGSWSKTWRVTNDGGTTHTLYASWTPPDQGNIGAFSSPRSGPFELSYGQRWELKSDEGQNVKVSVNATEPGTHRARLYMWWDRRGDFEWHRVYEFRVIVDATLPPPLPPPLPPDPATLLLPAITNLLLD